jgi:hypothetical protein
MAASRNRIRPAHRNASHLGARGEGAVEAHRYPLVRAVEDLGVDYELHENPDRSYTVHFRPSGTRPRR